MPFVLLALCFGFLLPKLYGSVAPYRDSGDLIASAFSLGIAHPPGYCFYTLLTKIGMGLFPLGNFAFRANFLSALWTCLTLVLLFQILKKWAAPLTVLLALSIWFFSPSVFQLSVVSEMYSLNGLFCALALYALLHAGRDKKNFIFLGFFLIGLGLTNHPTLIFIAPGALLYCWVTNLRAEQTGKEKLSFLAQLFFFACLGFTLILFYPVRSFQDPLVDWGNPETFRGLWRLITRADYGGLKLHPEESTFSWTAGGLFNQLKFFCQMELKEFGWWGTFSLSLGFFSLMQKMLDWKQKDSPSAEERILSAPVLFLFGVPFLISGPLFFLLSNLPVGAETSRPILEPYLFMTNLFAVPFTALGITKFFALFQKKLFYKRALESLALASLILFSTPKSFRWELYAYDYGKNLLKTMGVNSSLYEPDDTTAFVLSYFQTVENKRNDIVQFIGLKTFWGYEQIKKRYAAIAPTGDFRSAQEFIPALLSHQRQLRRGVYSDHSSKFPPDMPAFPVGILSKSGTIESITVFEKMQSIFNFYVERQEKSGLAIDRHSDFFTRHLLSRMSAAMNNIGIVFQNHKQFDSADRYFRQALARHPALPEAWNNLGINFYLQEDYASAEKIFGEGIRKTEGAESLYYHLALAQRKNGKNPEARNSLQKVLKLNPKNIGALNELGLIFLGEKDWNAARLWFEKCAEISPDYAPARYNLGLVYRFLGLNRDSAESFEKYLRLSPQDADARQIQEWIAALRQAG